ncbi:MAG: 50S ribosome-binding GTPase [Candidatus Adiutrix sp.]|jgi:sulfate adenylyltransferase large subunit|nr:50S ribosome-binding GTPase [Candidatus Adiutrix sp.]
METSRDILKIVVAGHVDHGKSTVIGRLLYDADALPQGVIDKVRRIAGETGKAFEFAYLLDAFEEEQKQGITIDTTQLQFHTAKRDYVIIDAPGHKEFLKNMISGAADAEAAFLVIDAARGVEEQSKRHAYMLSLLGIKQVCVIVNKMDLAAYAARVYRRISRDMDAFLEPLGLKARAYIPLSALKGDNVLRRSDNLDWYDGHTLIQALDAFVKEGRHGESRLRLPVQDVYKFDDRRIIAGRLEMGRLKEGDAIVIHPGGKKTTVRALAYWLEKDRAAEAGPGQSIGLILEDEFFNRRGEVISHETAPPLTTRSFQASLFWMGQSRLRVGQKYKLKIATQETEAEIGEIIRVIDASTLAAGPGAEGVKLNDVAEVIIKAREAVVLDLFVNCPATGRFVLVDDYNVVGGGIVTGVEAAPEAFRGFVSGDMKVGCDLFEEYYYSVEDQAVNKLPGPGLTYTVGEAVPLAGKSFSYPEFFDIAAFREKMVVKIRAGLTAEVLPLEEYRYGGLPVVDGRGFAFRISSCAQWAACAHDYAAATVADEAALSAKWLDFSAYRTIPFAGGA